MKNEEQKNIPQPALETSEEERERQLDEQYGITRKEALDKVLKICAESKKEIAQGNYYTLEESFGLVLKYREENLKRK